jgi:hypothetical protein
MTVATFNISQRKNCFQVGKPQSLKTTDSALPAAGRKVTLAGKHDQR